jgi:hypothetical protein
VSRVLVRKKTKIPKFKASPLSLPSPKFSLPYPSQSTGPKSLTFFVLALSHTILGPIFMICITLRKEKEMTAQEYSKREGFR